jgi:hypothetical protein
MPSRHVALALLSSSLLVAGCKGDTIISDDGAGGAGSGGDDAPAAQSTSAGDGDGDGDGGSPPTGPRQVSLDARGWFGASDTSDVHAYVHTADGTQKAALLDGTFPTEVEAEPGDVVTFVFPGGFYLESYRVTPEVEVIVGSYGGLAPLGCGSLPAPMRLRVNVPAVPGANEVFVALSNGSTEHLEGGGATIEIVVSEACPAPLDLLATAVDESGAVLGFEHGVVPVASGTEAQIDLAITDDTREEISISTSLPPGARAAGRASWWGPSGIYVEDYAQNRVADEGASMFVYEPAIIAPGFGSPGADVSVGLVLEGTGPCDVAELHQLGSPAGALSFDPTRLRWLVPAGDSWSLDGPGELGTRLLRHRRYETESGITVWNVFEDPGAPAALVLPAIPLDSPLGELELEHLIHEDDHRGGYGASIATPFSFESLIETRNTVPCPE